MLTAPGGIIGGVKSGVILASEVHPVGQFTTTPASEESGEMERAAWEEEGKSKEIVEATEMEDGGNEKEENHGEDVPEKAEKGTKAVETIVEKDQDGDMEEREEEKKEGKEEGVREVDGGAQTVQELSSIKVKVSRFDSLDVTDAKIGAGTLDEADAKANLASSVDETDAKKIKDFFSKHQEEPPHRGNEVHF